ncbi:oligopeptide/dipeptide ABC transporter ATP-binding protein [Dactylosporangium salmoneum]|uniref:Dipeptide ABC transporter ATP-binding protein n=1 Tax=Dactylosporangium salmoneum TaxID=53361 RepID=A0ABN3H1H2_9ACTN
MTEQHADEAAVLEVRDLEVRFPVRRGLLGRPASWVYAVNDVSLDLYRGETLGLVGESGSGKSTVGRAIVRVNQPSKGAIRLDGQDLLALHGTRLRPFRRRVQMVFQDPYASLDPRQSVGQALAEPLRVHGLAAGRRAARVAELLELVGLDPSFAARYPHQFSGGQRQRIGIARALAVEPDVIVCDEPVSALDVSIQAQVVNLLAGLQRQLGIAYLFIAHDLAVVRHLAHRVAVMYLGSIVETGPSEAVYGDPRHPYTTALLSAVPVPDAVVEKTRRRTILRGDIPSPENPPTGCLFHTRCPLRDMLGSPEVCSTKRPPLQALTPGHHRTAHHVACHFADDPRARRTAADVAGSLTADQPR